MARVLTSMILAAGLSVASSAAVQAHEEWRLAQDCVEALEQAPEEKFDAESLAVCEKAVAASSNNPELLGMLGATFSKFGNPERAAAILESAVALGDVDAMTGLGLFYMYGHGVRQDFARAAVLFMKPAEAGDPRAQNGLGRLYESGLGLPQSNEIAIRWYRRAAEQGYQRAAANLRRLGGDL